MLHVVRTAFGDSTDSYGGDDCGEFQLPCMGVFQGNKAGPPIWSIVSSIIFDALRKQGYKFNFDVSNGWMALMLVQSSNNVHLPVTMTKYFQQQFGHWDHSLGQGHFLVASHSV